MSLGGRFTTLGLRRLTKPGVYPDGGRTGLYLQVTGEAGRSWLFRYKHRATGKTVWLGLGSARDVLLAEARAKAQDFRRQLIDGHDPRDAKRAQKAKAQTALTFRQVAERYIADRELGKGWSDPRAATIWRSSLERLAYKHVGDKPVASITTDDVLAILQPIWTTTNETANRLRGRIETILSYAAAERLREGDNPARWRGHLDGYPSLQHSQAVSHHAAVPHEDIAAVMAKLAQSKGMGALAVRFACLTAARSNEARAARWAEIDLKAALWTIPAARMKARKEHRVPLSAPAVAILKELHLPDCPGDALVFTGGRSGRPLSDVALSKALHLAAGTKGVTVHGLRSTFRDWCGDVAGVPREIAEAALAHAVGNAVEQTYRRGDALDKRATLMKDWAAFCAALPNSTTAAPADAVRASE